MSAVSAGSLGSPQGVRWLHWEKQSEFSKETEPKGYIYVYLSIFKIVMYVYASYVYICIRNMCVYVYIYTEREERVL
jgi:hypothetical protein